MMEVSSRWRSVLLSAVAVFPLVAALASGAGCSYERRRAAVGDVCTATAECRSELLCIDSICRNVCVEDDDCPIRTERCRDGACFPAVAVTCGATTECDPPQVCEGVVCSAGACEYSVAPSGTTCEECTGDSCSCNGLGSGSANCVSDQCPAGACCSSYPSDLASTATRTGIAWDGVDELLTLDGMTQQWSLPDGGSAAGWIDMTGNVLLMHMDGEMTASIYDASGRGHHGAIFGSLSRAQTGKLLGSVGFPADFDYIVVSDHADLSFTDLTVSFWARATVMPDQGKFVVGEWDHAAGTGFREWSVEAHADGSFELEVTVDGEDAGGVRIFSGAGSFTVGRWVHVVAVFDSLAANRQKLYVNGVLKREAPGATSIHDSGSDLIIGGKSPASSVDRWFDGDLDELALWNRALTGDEVETIYERQAPVLSGSFDSEIFDAGVPARWSELAWVPSRPTLKEAPAVAEDGYLEDNLDGAGLIAMWHGNDIVGLDGEVDDASANALNGTASGDVSVASGRFNRALRFGDGVAGFGTVTVPDAAVLDRETFSVSLWFRTQQPWNAVGWPPIGTLIAKYRPDVGPSGWAVAGGSTEAGGDEGRVSVAVGPFDTGPLWTTSARTGLNDGRWHHLVFTRTPLLSTLYLDGSRDVELVTNGESVINDSELTIGGDVLGSGVAFVGALDEIAMWDHDLLVSDVEALYRRGAAALRFQVRACAAPCISELWLGPDGSSATFYSELGSVASGPPALLLQNVTDNRYFQYRAYLDSFDGQTLPELSSVMVTVCP